MGVGQRFPHQCSAFEFEVGGVHGVGHQVPHASGENIGVDSRVGGDAGHQPGLRNADLAA